jgi:hypothetical protein
MIHHVTSTALRPLPEPKTLKTFAFAERGGWR